jgi:hypothetical protein
VNASGQVASYASAINASGQVVGSSVKRQPGALSGTPAAANGFTHAARDVARVRRSIGRTAGAVPTSCPVVFTEQSDLRMRTRMSDTSPTNQKALVHDAPPAPRRQPKRGELLFEFYRERDHSRWLCELRDHGPVYGVEAQSFRDEEVFAAHTFPPSLDPSRTSRDMAIAWSEEERKYLEGH